MTTPPNGMEIDPEALNLEEIDSDFVSVKRENTEEANEIQEPAENADAPPERPTSVSSSIGSATPNPVPAPTPSAEESSVDSEPPPVFEFVKAPPKPQPRSRVPRPTFYDENQEDDFNRALELMTRSAIEAPTAPFFTDDDNENDSDRSSGGARRGPAPVLKLRPLSELQQVQSPGRAVAAGPGQQSLRDPSEMDVAELRKEVAYLRNEVKELKEGVKKADVALVELEKIKKMLASSGKPGQAAANKQQEVPDKVINDVKKAFKANVDAIQRMEIAPLKTGLYELEKTVKGTAEEMKESDKDLRKRLGEQEKIIWNLKGDVGLIRKTVISEMSGRTWVIKDFAKKSMEARNKNVVIESFPLRSAGKAGYKLVGMAYLNGAGEARGTHLSLCWRLVPSPEDPYLSWPFREHVCFRIAPPSQPPPLSQQRAPSLSQLSAPPLQEIIAETPVYDGPPFQRPVIGKDQDTDRWEGIQKFIRLDELRNYVVDDTLAIHITVWPKSGQ